MVCGLGEMVWVVRVPSTETPQTESQPDAVEEGNFLALQPNCGGELRPYE
jgi:hypothetical protein